MSSPPALPRGTYATYKRATSYFLTWLLRVRPPTVSLSSDDCAPQPLDVYEQIVDAIAAAPLSSLSPALLQRLPHALEACQSAITLRARVALLLGESADDAHAHFLARLTSWYATLQTVTGQHSTSSNTAHATAPRETLDLSNYYSVLALPDDFFADDVSGGTARDAAGSLGAASPLSRAARKRIEDDVFADDFSTQVACMFMELDDISEAVYTAFLDVKRETKTLVEATVVAKVAIDSAATIVAHLQLWYPHALRNGSDLSTLIHDRLSLGQMHRLVATVQLAWMPTDDASEIRHQYVPGTVLMDIVGIVGLLRTIATHMPLQMNAFGTRYDEETTRHYVVPEWGHQPRFFLYHLPMLLNLATEIRELGFVTTPHSLGAWLLEPFETFAKTGAISTDLVVRCICWIRSIAALRGNRGLARTVGLSIHHMWDLRRRVGESIVTNGGRGPFADHMKALHVKLEAMSSLSPYMRVNPLLAGCFALDQQMTYVSIGSDALLLTLFRPFCHVYSALRDRHLIDKVPFVEDVLHVYEDSVFTPSRAAATHGSFVRSFLASTKLVEVTVTRRRNKPNASQPAHATSVIQKGRIEHNSGIVRLLRHKDYSVLPNASSSSWPALLSAVSELSRDDLFGSRVLSRDTLKLSDDITNVFNALCDAFDRRDHVDRADPGPVRNRALENAVVFSLLPLLDAPANANADQSDVGGSQETCQRAAATCLHRHRR